MTVAFNHTIVWSSDRAAAAAFFADIYGLPAPQDLYHFKVVKVAHGVSIDFADREGPISPQHYAFLVSDEEFDGIMARIEGRGLTFWADPARKRPGEINRNDGGRGVYFEGPDGHFYEALTVPYGGES
ncbi:MAG: VOC family protein [Novosphingobium sp.]|nr:VOC family protein [Novosphingobium sp.]